MCVHVMVAALVQYTALAVVNAHAAAHVSSVCITLTLELLHLHKMRLASATVNRKKAELRAAVGNNSMQSCSGKLQVGKLGDSMLPIHGSRLKQQCWNG